MRQIYRQLGTRHRVQLHREAKHLGSTKMLVRGRTANCNLWQIQRKQEVEQKQGMSRRNTRLGFLRCKCCRMLFQTLENRLRRQRHRRHWAAWAAEVIVPLESLRSRRRTANMKAQCTEYASFHYIKQWCSGFFAFRAEIRQASGGGLELGMIHGWNGKGA